jgi:dihydrofolate reductase
MKVIWNPALTLDGFIAKLDGDSDWVTEKDGSLFHDLIKECGGVIVGRTTYEQYVDKVFPIEGATTFVWTKNPEAGKPRVGVEYVSGDPQDVIKRIEQKGLKEVVLAGGGITNNIFVSAGLVNEIIAAIYPLVFGEGIRLLSTNVKELKLELVEVKEVGDGVVHHRYKVT